MTMIKQAEVSQEDPRFVAAVVAVLEKRIPKVVGIERYLSALAIVLTLLSLVGILPLGAWIARVAWQNAHEDFIRSTVKKVVDEPKSSVSLLTENVNNMSKTLNATFETQVDSAMFKILRFGCTPPKSPVKPGFPPCTSAGEFQAQEDLRILLVANPATQIVRLDISLYPVDELDKLQPLYIELFVQPPPTRAMGDTFTGMLALRPEHVAPNGGEMVKDGRLRLFPESGGLNARVDLTSSLKEKNLSGPMQLRFKVVKEQRSRSSTTYEDATGTELFYLRTITSAYHSILAAEKR